MKSAIYNPLVQNEKLPMKNRIQIALAIVLAFTTYSCKNSEYLRQYAAVEVYPGDTLLAQLSVKKAMIVIAHDDDMCAMAGTISLLNKKGWTIAVMSFSKSPERNEAQLKACRNILDTVIFIDLQPEQYRNDMASVKNPYDAIPKSEFDRVFNRSLVAEHYIKEISAFNPSVIFTLDNEMGGYGHPEHVFASQLVIDLAQEKKINPMFIYQSVYTNHMENSIMKRHSERMKSWGFPGDEWEQSKRVYGVTGMPEPTVQFEIKSEAVEKMNYLRSYNKREREILGFFIPDFEDFKADDYFEIFDREFYRIISF
jgi:N-acetylglucosamine malate deacetylase 2